MTKLNWQPWPEDCPRCNACLAVLTLETAPGSANENDSLHCDSCGLRGIVKAEKGPRSTYAAFPDPLPSNR